MAIAAVVALAVAAPAGAQMYTGGPVTIPDTGSAPVAGDPYPSTITATDERFVTDVDVRLYGFRHDDASDMDMLLVGPGGQRALLVSDVNGVPDGVSLRFDDEAAAPVTDAGVAGTYRPTDVDDGLGDQFLAPVLPGPFGSSLAVFDGPDGSGPWALYVVDDTEWYGGSIAGWNLLIHTRPPASVGFSEMLASPVTEDAGAIAYTVKRLSGNPVSGNPVYAGSVQYAAGPYRPEDVLAGMPQPGAQATVGRDYEAVSGTLQFAAGETEKSFTVPILDDRVFDGRKSFAVRLSDPAGDTALTPFVASVVSIRDDEPEPVAPRLGGRRVQRVLRQRAVLVTARTNFDGTVRASGTVTLGKGVAIRLRNVGRTVTASKSVKLKLSLSRKGMAAVRRALATRKTLNAKVKVVGTNLAGHREFASRRITLIR